MQHSVRKTVVSLSSTGVGKSTLGNTVTGANNFTTSADPRSETQETVGKDGTFRDLLVHYIDTPGLNDSQGLDSTHIRNMVDHLKARDVIDGVLIGLNYQDPRLSSSLRNMLKLFCYTFSSSQFSRSVCFVFTHSFRLRDDVALQKQVEVSRVFNEILTQTGLAPAGDLQPCFFVDNGSMSERNEQELTRLQQWISQLSPLRTDLLNHADPQFEKIEEETREIETRAETVPITETRQKPYQVQVPRQVWAGGLGKVFGNKKTVYDTQTRYTAETVQTGTRTTKYHEAQKRVKKTTYAGQVVFTDWSVVRSWQVVVTQ